MTDAARRSLGESWSERSGTERATILYYAHASRRGLFVLYSDKAS